MGLRAADGSMYIDDVDQTLSELGLPIDCSLVQSLGPLGQSLS